MRKNKEKGAVVVARPPGLWSARRRLYPVGLDFGHQRPHLDDRAGPWIHGKNMGKWEVRLNVAMKHKKNRRKKN